MQPVLVLERTHYDDTMLEVIAPVSIKERGGIQNGDAISIKVQISHDSSTESKSCKRQFLVRLLYWNFLFLEWMYSA